MFAIVHSSVATESAGSFDALVPTWRQNNERDAVTGCLLYVYAETGGLSYFAQILEGSQDAVEAVYGRIVRDRRHRDVRLLRSGPIQTRRFTDSPLRLAELPSARLLVSVQPRGTSVEAAIHDAAAMAGLLASYGDDPAPLNPASPFGGW